MKNEVLFRGAVNYLTFFECVCFSVSILNKDVLVFVAYVLPEKKKRNIFFFFAVCHVYKQH